MTRLVTDNPPQTTRTGNLIVMKINNALARTILFCMLCFSATAGAKQVLVFGDSLSAGYGMTLQQGWVHLLRERLVRHNISVVNGSVSGEITANGAKRLPGVLARENPDLVIIELGANDGLRGMRLDAMYSNLNQMIQQSLQSNARVLLLGMKIPPNYGPQYTEQFHAVYTRLATQYDIAFVPFFLEKVMEQANLFQSDNIHPNAAAQSLLLETVWPEVSALVF